MHEMASADSAGGRPNVQVDASPAYDFLLSFSEIVRRELKLSDRWADWVRQTADQLTVAQQRRMQRYRIARAYVALIPTLPEPRGIGQFLHDLAAIPLADFLRVAVTVGYTDPETPLSASGLLALAKDKARARTFIDRYLRVTSTERTNLLHILADPEAARGELVALLTEYASGPFAALEPELRDARERAVPKLHEIAGEGRESWPEWIVPYARLEGFSPIVLAPSAFLDIYSSVYYHEIQQPLFDDTTYEPFIITIGTQKILSPTPLRRRGQATLSGTMSADPAERYSAVFAALADPSRVRLVRLLAERPRYGQELAQAMGMSAATISHHVNTLLRVGLVTVERQSHRTYYVLQAEVLAALLRAGEAFALDRDAPQPQEKEGEA